MEIVIRLFNDYVTIVCKTKCKAKYWNGLKVLTPKQMLQLLKIPLAQVKPGSTSEVLLNAIHQFMYFFVLSKRNC